MTGSFRSPSEYATASYLDVVGLAPSRGSWFEALADDPTGPPATVLTHKMWTDRLGSDPDVLGSTIRIGGSAVTVIGVGPATFNGGAGPASIDLWLSISAMRPTGGRAFSLDRRQDHPFTVRARLASGISVVDASAAIDRLASELARTYPTQDLSNLERQPGDRGAAGRLEPDFPPARRSDRTGGGVRHGRGGAGPPHRDVEPRQSPPRAEHAASTENGGPTCTWSRSRVASFEWFCRNLSSCLPLAVLGDWPSPRQPLT